MIDFRPPENAYHGYRHFTLSPPPRLLRADIPHADVITEDDDNVRFLGGKSLLHGFIKKTQKTPKSDLDLAIKRMKEYMS